MKTATQMPPKPIVASNSIQGMGTARREKRWPNQPEEIYESHAENDDGDNRQTAGVSL